ncbi:flagellar export chaperone FliS [Leeia oryzae]|uniref:flagellar export chaperone FliS n=1 Tax=Leeia oryzae TaxID=356662 RepID=UPI0003769126|nr:flagellar export chaperone FliS [Leeia oryzae]
MVSRALDAYRNVNIDSAVLSASPVELIVMLYDGAMAAIMRAKGEIEQKNFPAKSALISKATNIVVALRGALNLQIGGELALNLQDLYLYVEKTLMEANLKNDPALLDEAHKLLAELRGAWEELSKSGMTGQQKSSGDTTATISYGKV